MSSLDEYFAKVNRGSQKASSVSASGDKPASNMDAYFAKAGKPSRTNPLNLYTEVLKTSQNQSTMQTPYADAAAQLKQGNNAAKGTSTIFNSVFGKADDRESSAGSGKYADILKASDYAELSKSGESKRKLFGDARYDYINNIGNFRAQSDVQQAQGRGQDYAKYAFMTDDEVGVYNYLYATQGKKAANSYLSDLEPELDKQWYTGTNRATTEALGKNAATRTLASAATVAAQPTRTITSTIAMADDAIRTAKGQEINPYSKWRQASNITQDLRSDTSQHIEETNPGFGGKVGSFVYNTAMSAADSYMNSLVASGFGEAAGLSGKDLMKVTNILGSALMSSEVASLSTAEGKEKGYSNAGAMSLGLTRGAVEFMSEMLGGEWVIKNIKANPLNSVKSMALNMIPEGMEEVMSDATNGAVNLVIDALFGTEESGIPKMLEYYRSSGTEWQKKHPELATVLTILGQEGLSFLGGALATFGTSAVQTHNMRTSINTTAERLDTTPQNVVQMMQDMETEDPGVVYALAGLTDAENADDLRQKIGTKENMKRAASYLEEQMKAGGRSGAQEGTYTAETQNAPVGTQRAQTAINQTLEANPSDRFAATSPIMGGKGEGGSQTMEGEFGNGQSAYQGRENGAYDLRTGGQAAAEGRAQALTGGRAEIPGGVGQSTQADLRQVTAAQLGIKNGGTEAVTVVDAQRLGGEAKSAYDTVTRRGMEPIAIRGALQVGNGYANAYTESGKVYFRVDAVDSSGNAISPEALVHHELFHNYISEEGLRASAEVIRESMTAEEYDSMYEAYRDAYASIYDFETMSVEEIERILREEIAADAYAGLNFFSDDAQVQEAVRAEAERNAPAQRAEAQRETTGPPGRATAAGINARTADSATLRRAEALEKSGTDNEAIRQETGWYRGMDGRWRFEIDDSGMKTQKAYAPEREKAQALREYTAQFKNLTRNGLTNEQREMLREYVSQRERDEFSDKTYQQLTNMLGDEFENFAAALEGKMGASAGEKDLSLAEYINHPKLFEAYPDLKNVTVRFDSLADGQKGYFSKRDNTIVLSDSLFGKEADVVLHEIQHVIQGMEGFTGGASPQYWNDRMEKGFSKRWTSGEEMMPSELYRNTAGEIEARDTAARRRMTAEERKNTPPNLGDADTVFADGNTTSYSIDENFGKNVDDWVRNTPEDMLSTSPGYFRVGTTSEALQSIGARTDNIYMRKSKIGTIFEDHPEVNVDVIKKVPNILENPVLIMKSLTRSDSIVLLSEEKTKNGNSLMVALELTPKPGGRTEAEFSLVTSAYGRADENLRNLINNSELLYLDTNKNRANTWLMQLRVQFPSRQPPYGSIGNIAYAEDGVKITGKKLSDLGGAIQKDSSGRASVEVENREPRYTVIDGTDAAGKESALADAYDKAVEQGKGAEISEADLKKYQDIRDNPEQTLIEAVKKYYEESLKGTSVEVTANDGIVEIRFENDGKKKSVGWRMKADKAATFEKLHQLTENAEYAYSEANRNENERTSIPMFHYFVNNARIAGRDIPVKIQVRDVITNANSKETHYYTHTLEKNMRGNSGPVAGTQSANIDSNATAPSETNIRSTTGNSQEKSSGRASVEVENRDSNNENRDSDNKKGRKKLSEAEKYQNTTVKKPETRTVRNAAEYEKQISRMEKRLETGGQATLNEGGSNFYRANIREENGEYYSYISDGKNVVAKHRSKSKMEAIRWAGDRVRAEIASRILYNPDTELRGSYQSDLKSAENREYPVFKTKSGTEVQTVPFWTWVQDKAGHYGLVVGNDVNGAVRAWFPFGGDGNGTVISAPNTTLYAVEGDYESRAWNNDIVADVLNDVEESAAARNAREERLRESREADQQRLDRMTKRDEALHQINRENGRPMPNKGAGEVYRELMSKGKSEVVTPISMDNPRTLSYKITLESDIVGVTTATVMHNGHQIYKDTGPIKEYVARDVAEFVDVQANKDFSHENFERARQLEAEKTGDEDARIAELFGDSEQVAKQELTDKTAESLTEKGRAEEAEKYAARATVDATTEKVTSEVLKAERNFREDFEKITSGAMRMFVNAGDTVRRIAKATKSKSLEGYYFNAGAYSQRAGNWIAKGGARTDIDGHKIGASLADTLAPMRKDTKKYRDFQLYLLHMHNVDRMKYDNSAELERIKDELKRVKDRYPQLRELSAQELARVASDAADDPITRAEAHEMYIEAHQGKNPRIGTVNMAAAYIQELQKQRAIVEKQGLKPVFGYDVTADDSRTAAMLLAAENPEFKEWAKEVYKYSDDLIRYRVEAGLITREFADALKKRYPHYIPTFREEGTNSRKARSARRNGGIVVSNAIGRAVGSDGVLLPLHTALSRKTVSTMRNAGLNQFGLALVREYDGNKKAAEKYIWNVAESEYTPTEAALESDEDYKPVFENIFSVKENGKAYDITMDEGLTAAMKAFEPDKFANYGAAKAMKKLNDIFKALCTGYNPFFMIRNGVRDWQDAGFYSTDWKTWEKMYWSAWKQIRTNGEIWQQYVALGGSYASMLDYTTGMVKEPKNLIGKAAARYERLGQAIEAAPRLAEFMTILANKGGSKTVDGVKTGQFTQSDLMEAMLGAADITTNFARGGSVTKMLNRYLVPFLNPSIQGFDKFLRNATEIRSVKAAGSLILKAALMGIAPALINALAYRDDDEWDDIPANTKANYYLIKLPKFMGDGYWLKIPKGRAIAVLSTAAVYTQEKQKGEDVKFSDVFEVIKSNIAPTDIFNQNIATAWTQAKLTNPDNPGTTWYGGNIESDRLQNYRPGDRYDENTDALSKAIGQKFNISPKKLNYLLDQYSGVIGDLLLPLITPATKSSHWLLAAPQAAFTIDTTSTNKTTGEYYDLLDDLKYDANDGDAGAGITRKYVSHAGDEVNDYYAQIRELQNDKNLSDGEKNRLVRALKSQLIERQKEIIAQAEPYREAVDKYLKAHPELSTDNDAAVAEYAELYDISEDQAESRMDAIVYREANREVFGAEYALRTYNADVYDKARTAYAKGVSYETYYDYYFATKEMHADKDENGKSISGSKKAKVVEYINSLDIPAEQKDALYVAAGYTEKSARYQKWNGGSGGSGRSGKRTTLKAPAPKAGKIIIPEASAKTGSTAKSGTTKTAKASGNVIADFTQKSSGTDIRKAVTQAKKRAIKAGNRTLYVEEGSPIDYFLKYGKLPSVK